MSRDCKRRPLVADAASLVLFVFTLIPVMQSVWPSLEQEKALRRFFQLQGSSPALESNVAFYKWLLFGAGVGVSVYLGRLYVSLQLFDRTDESFHSYIRHIKRLRPVEWAIRLSVYVLLLLALQYGFGRVAAAPFGLIASATDWGWSAALLAGLDTPPTGAERFLPVTIFLLLLFMLFLLWDAFLFLCYFISKEWKEQTTPTQLAHRFLLAHILGFTTWSLLSAVFLNPTRVTISPAPTAVLCTMVVLVLIADTLLALVGRRGDGLIRRALESYAEPAAFAFRPTECEADGHTS